MLGNIRFEVEKLPERTINHWRFVNHDNGGTGGVGGVDGDHIAMGSLSGATTNIANENNYLMEKLSLNFHTIVQKQLLTG
jgi:hypothetical protein